MADVLKMDWNIIISNHLNIHGIIYTSETQPIDFYKYKIIYEEEI
jgi:hypothetical protein